MRMDTIPPSKKLIISDLDNCLVDSLEIFGTLKKTLADIAQGRNLPLELLYDLTREAEGEHRFNDAVGLIDYMNKIEPRFKTDSAHHQAIDYAAKKEWLETSSSLSTFYPGIADAIHKFHEIGANFVMRTDAERLPVIRRVWLTAFNAAAAGDMESPYDALSLYDRIYCRPSLNDPEPENFAPYLARFSHAYDVPLDFALALSEHMTVGAAHKPSPSFIEHILDDFGTSHRETLYLGDSYKDGLEAQCLDGRRVDFAWTLYGADWRNEVRDFYAEVGSKSWRYGREEIRHQLKEHGVRIHHTLENSISDVFNRYSFACGNTARRDFATARDIRQLPPAPRANLG